MRSSKAVTALSLLAVAALTATPALAQTCGGLASYSSAPWRSGANGVFSGDMTALTADISYGTNNFFGGPLNVTETGGATASNFAWTNVAPDGTTVGSVHCQAWTSGSSVDQGRSGRTTTNGQGWTDGNLTRACNLLHHLYCFQQ